MGLNNTEVYNEGYIDGYNQAVKDKSSEFVNDLKDLIYNETVSSSGKLFIDKELTLKMKEKWEEKLK